MPRAAAFALRSFTDIAARCAARLCLAALPTGSLAPGGLGEDGGNGMLTAGADGDGEGEGLGDGDGEGLGDGEGEGLGEGEGEGCRC